MTARRLGVIILAPLVLLSLGTCGLFLASPFPLDMAQAMAVRDFSSSIPDSAEDSFRPVVLENGSLRLVLLVGGYSPKTGSAPFLYVMSDDLAILQELTWSKMQSYNVSFSGTNAAMVDSQGRAVVANVLFAMSDSGLQEPGAPAGTLGAPNPPLKQPAFPVGLMADNIINVSSDGFNLQWDQYLSDWCCWSSPPSVRIRVSGNALYLQRVLAEPYDKFTPALLVFEEAKSLGDDPLVSYFVTFPRMPPPVDFLGQPMYPFFKSKDIESKSIGMTSEGIVAYSYDTGDWMLLEPGTGKVLNSIHIGSWDDDGRAETTWSYSGGFSVTYDSRSHVLTKAAKWWD
jgi:hypothetical protein